MCVCVCVCVCVCHFTAHDSAHVVDLSEEGYPEDWIHFGLEYPVAGFHCQGLDLSGDAEPPATG